MKPEPKIPLAEALALLRQGFSKAQLARRYGCSRSAVSQRVKAHAPSVPPGGKSVEALLVKLDAANPELARTLRQHAAVELVSGGVVRIRVHGNLEAEKTLKNLPTHTDALRRLWKRPVGVAWR